MTTKIIGVKELRQNLSQVTKQAVKNKQRYLVFKNNTPVFEITPISKKEAARARFIASVKEGLEDVKAGKVHSLAELKKQLGI